MAALQTIGRRSWAVILLVFSLAQFCRAEIQFDVFPGFGGVSREAHWFPVSFEIKNDGPPFSAHIELSSAQLGRSQVRRVPIDLPTGTLKRVTVPVYSAARYGNWSVRLRDDRGKVRAEQTISGGSQLRQVNHNTILLGSLARTTPGSPAFPNAARWAQTEFQPATGRMLPSFFPDNPIALDGLHALYLSSERALELKPPQIEALLGWLNSGGHLIVGIEEIVSLNGAPWLKNLLPCEVTAMTRVATAGVFQDWLRLRASQEPEHSVHLSQHQQGQRAKTLWVAAGTNMVPDHAFEAAEIDVARAIMRDGRPVFSHDGVPLMVECGRGMGKITVLLFSPERQPFSAWKNRPWFWAALLKVPAALYDNSDLHNYGGWSSDGVFGAMIESRQIRKLPLGFLLLLLVVYLIVIGPLDQFWLKRINRQMLTWITFPCYVVLFSALIYFIGFKLRAGDSEWNELHIVDVIPQGDGAVLRGKTYAAVYSPANQEYPLEGGQSIAALRGEYLANWGNGEESMQAEILHTGNTFKARIFVPVWTSQLYVNDWWQPAPIAPLQVTAHASRAALTIRNRGDRQLGPVRVVYRGRVLDAGEIEPGASRELALDDSGGMELAPFVQQFGGRFFDASQMRRRTFGGDARPEMDLPLASMAASFISQLNDAGAHRHFIVQASLELTRLATEENAIVLAWEAGVAPVPRLNRFEPRRSSRNSLYRMVVPLNPQPQS